MSNVSQKNEMLISQWIDENAASPAQQYALIAKYGAMETLDDAQAEAMRQLINRASQRQKVEASVEAIVDETPEAATAAEAQNLAEAVVQVQNEVKRESGTRAVAPASSADTLMAAPAKAAPAENNGNAVTEVQAEEGKDRIIWTTLEGIELTALAQLARAMAIYEACITKGVDAAKLVKNGDAFNIHVKNKAYGQPWAKGRKTQHANWISDGSACTCPIAKEHLVNENHRVLSTQDYEVVKKLKATGEVPGNITWAPMDYGVGNCPHARAVKLHVGPFNGTVPTAKEYKAHLGYIRGRLKAMEIEYKDSHGVPRKGLIWLKHFNKSYFAKRRELGLKANDERKAAKDQEHQIEQRVLARLKNDGVIVTPPQETAVPAPSAATIMEGVSALEVQIAQAQAEVEALKTRQKAERKANGVLGRIRRGFKAAQADVNYS